MQARSSVVPEVQASEDVSIAKWIEGTAQGCSIPSKRMQSQSAQMANVVSVGARI